MKLKKIISQILVIAMLMSFVSVFAVIPSNASTSLSSALAVLRENIELLYVKGPAISSEAVKKMRIDGIPSEYDYEGGDYKIFTDRLKFEAYLASVDPYDDYFFTNKSSFINLFNGDETFIDGYKWYISASSAGVSSEDSLIKYNLSNLVMYASDVYAFCNGANDVFPEKLDSKMVAIVNEATGYITKVLNGLKAQIKTGSDKPNNYKGEYLREYPTEANGVFPYLKNEFNSNNQNKYKTGLIGYYDSSAYTTKTYTYAEVKASSASAAALSAFESAYNTYKAKSDDGRLYYDYLQDIEPVNEAYAKLCDSLVSSSASSVDLTSKATAYNKLKAYVEFFDKWIIPNIDSYSNALIINITTAKWIIGFVRDEACFLNSIALTGETSLNSLVANIESDIKNLSALSDLSASVKSEYKDNVTLINNFVSDIYGISDGNYRAEFTSLYGNADRISDIEAASFVYTSEAFVSFNGKIIETSPVSVNFSMKKSVYEALVEVATYEYFDLSMKLFLNTPFRLCSDDLFGSLSSDSEEESNINDKESFNIIKQLCTYIFLEDLFADEDGLSVQSKAILKEINGTSGDYVDAFFKAFFTGGASGDVEDYIDAISAYSDNEDITFTLFETAVNLLGYDTNTYLSYLKTVATSVLNFLNLSSESFNAGGDGKTPNDIDNYPDEVLSDLHDICELIKTTSSSTNTELVTYRDSLDRVVKTVLSDAGYQGYETYCQKVFGGEAPALSSYITNNVDSYNFLLSVRAANATDDYAYSKLDGKLISPLKAIVEKFGKTKYTSEYIDVANAIISAVDITNTKVSSELTWQYCMNVLKKLDSDYAAISTAASGVSQKLITANALAKDSSKDTPYYSMLFKARDVAVSNATALLNADKVTLGQMEYALENLNLVIDAITTYTKPAEKESVSADKLKAKIDEAQILLERCQNANSVAVNELYSAISTASNSYAQNKDTFTASQLNTEISVLNAAIQKVRSSVLLDSTLLIAIENATKDVGKAENYTEETWKVYSAALTAANELAANSASKLQDCENALAVLEDAIVKLEKTEAAKTEEKTEEDKTEEDNKQTGETEKQGTEETGVGDNSQQNQNQNGNTSSGSNKAQYLTDAQSFFENAMTEFTQYMLSNKANNEKITVWKDSLQSLKSAIDANASETVIVEKIVTVQLAKSYLPVSNPDTFDD